MINKSDAKESELHLIHILREQNVNRVLIICAEDFQSQMYFTKLKERMQGAGLKLFLYPTQIENPSITLVEQCVHLFFSNDCQAILAIGGGSIIDLAKATKARIIRPDKSLHKLNGLGKIRASSKAFPILITSPTTITAGESSKVAWIIDHTKQSKFILNDRAIQPNYVMHCAEYVTTLPNQLLFSTSFGTLVQAFEALLSRNNSAYINKNAAEAISDILNCLENHKLFSNLSNMNNLSVSNDMNNLSTTNDLNNLSTTNDLSNLKKQKSHNRQNNNNQVDEIKEQVIKGEQSPVTLANKNQLIETLQNSAFKTGNAAGRSGVGYITAIANALAVFGDLPYSDVATVTLPLILETYLNIKPKLFNRFGSDFNIEKIIVQINELSKTWNITVSHKQINKQAKSLPMQEISEYVKKDINRIHSSPLILSDEKLDEILQKVSQRIFD
ncbi:MAG: iron-containing alcohol dehydrogenase [Clostridiaceae bacterium]|nr:iron-containing alcohol dehydrogenase [Clostridiaceae bacterium]